MRIKKIRGHKRIQERVERWREYNLTLDINQLVQSKRDYVKIRVHPFSSISVLNSNFAEPKGNTRTLILNSLIDIYDSWKAELDKLGRPYYLKIWLFDPYFSRSQVVCAIDEMLNFYDTTFHKPENTDPSKVGRAQTSLPDGFNWEFHLDEHHLSEHEIGEPQDYYSPEDYEAELRQFRKKLKKPHRVSTYTSTDGGETKYYSFKTGTVWVGERV